MKKTLLLVFIHGFKGGDDTFGDKEGFTAQLRADLAAALPKINVNVLVYPKYETRGDLGDCVSRFRDWLLEKVIDLEVANGTSSPTVDPSVRVVLAGHSMGGIVAAETVIGLTSEKPIYSEDGVEKAADSSTATFNSLMFPYIQGVIAFDTPYLGISPGVVAHGAEGHYNTANAAMTQLSGLGTALWGAKQAASPSPSRNKAPVAALPSPPANSSQQGGGGGGWGWGKIAMVAGSAAAVAASAGAAYYNREHITQGLTWATSHLEFVGCLAKGAELQKRVQYMVKLNAELDVGFANLYTRLGKAAGSKEVSVVGTVLGGDRTFCNLPKRDNGGIWKQAVNDVATEETQAHMNMFEPKMNPGYEKLKEDAVITIAQWTRNEWYESSGEDKLAIKEAGETATA
ncbi:hypothetical protein CORC01_06008 [Colletotrichum orchidophilum]|uniref:DUF676 domain-containing protein n=1 Tax=Colletotrichum orchidophilum TaxID=1209926 RepID=A0A1G4BBQ4_9PEZI|nr:uncharacterized protein CORC01_06008 [Colletotrichum orchidophilum]OHE98742.1 hypothetical protein CORC01_06008 [Colletotrichum orchidophilum]